jgi:hypothetical protein
LPTSAVVACLSALRHFNPGIESWRIAMKRVLGLGLLGLLVLAPVGCVAVSAEEVHHGMRYEAVAAADGKLYVVDTEKLTARPVVIMIDAEAVDP